MASILSGFTKTWNLGDLINIDTGRQSRASSCSVVLTNTFHEITTESMLEKFKKFFLRNKEQMKVYYVIFKFTVYSDTGNSYTVYIRTNPDYNMTEYMNNRIEVYCSCPDFMYRSAFILNNHKALFRSNSTDSSLGTSIIDPPKAKTKTTTLCKHSYAAVMYLVNNYSSIMQTL